MQLVVVIAVSAADSAAMTTRTMTSHTFFFSFIAFNFQFSIFNLKRKSPSRALLFTP